MRRWLSDRRSEAIVGMARHVIANPSRPHDQWERLLERTLKANLRKRPQYFVRGPKMVEINRDMLKLAGKVIGVKNGNE